jgi:hypothetical protein
MSRKVFTAGEVLAAADVNSFLMDQTVMSFAGTAARGSAIGTATEGMTTYLEDSKRLDFYTGSAWVPASGLTFIYSTSFTGVSSISLPNNTFTSLFDDYLIMANINAATDSGVITYRFRASGSDNSSANYAHALQQMGSGITTYSPINAGSQTSARVAFCAAGELGSLTMNVSNPLLAQRTNVEHTYTRNVNSSVINGELGFSQFGLTNSFDSMTFTAGAGNLTGILSVHGYRKN